MIRIDLIDKSHVIVEGTLEELSRTLNFTKPKWLSVEVVAVVGREEREPTLIYVPNIIKATRYR